MRETRRGQTGEVPTRPTRKHYEINAASEADETPAWAEIHAMYSLVTPAAIPNMQRLPDGPPRHHRGGGRKASTRSHALGNHSLPVAATVGLAVQVMGHAGSIMDDDHARPRSDAQRGTEVGGHLTPWGSDAHVHHWASMAWSARPGRPMRVKTTGVAARQGRAGLTFLLILGARGAGKSLASSDCDECKVGPKEENSG